MSDEKHEIKLCVKIATDQPIQDIHSPGNLTLSNF